MVREKFYWFKGTNLAKLILIHKYLGKCHARSNKSLYDDNTISEWHDFRLRSEPYIYSNAENTLSFYLQ